jgi:lipoate-protein ligase A
VSWTVHRATGPASAFHARPLPDPVVRAVHVLDVDRPALVLGSAQRDDVVDRAACEASGVEVVRRRSGGGAVLLEPGEVLWVDVELPRGDPLWDDDVGRASWWLGERWAAAIAEVGIPGAVVHRGAVVASSWSPLACFAGLGPGEVTLGVGGPKVVGISQRRTRAGARFQCAVPLTWAPARLASLLALDTGGWADLVGHLQRSAAAVERPAAELLDALRLPAG